MSRRPMYLPTPGQHLIKPVVVVIVDAREHVGEECPPACVTAAQKTRCGEIGVISAVDIIANRAVEYVPPMKTALPGIAP
jgi:hypothetical protein